jgi:hypothetical protein
VSGETIHKLARTTPELREQIRNSPLSQRELAPEYNVAWATIRKRKFRATVHRTAAIGLTG